jgi:hypothetical protein
MLGHLQELSVKLRKTIIAASAFFPLLTFKMAEACNLLFASPRLSAKCSLELVAGSRLSEAQYSSIEDNLEQIGAFPADTQFPKLDSEAHASMRLGYQKDLNGGNPDKPLVIAGIPFYSSDQHKREEGATIGPAAALNFSASWDQERLVVLDLEASHDASVTSPSSIFYKQIELCSLNYLASDFYLDLCSSKSETQKEYSTSRARKVSAAISRYVGASSSLGLEVADYNQDNSSYRSVSVKKEFLLGGQTYLRLQRSEGFMRSGIEPTLKWSNQLSLSKNYDAWMIGMSLTDSKMVEGSVLGFDYGYGYKTLRLLLGRGSLGFLELGYFKRRSNFDYFNEEYPILAWSKKF